MKSKFLPLVVILGGVLLVAFTLVATTPTTSSSNFQPPTSNFQSPIGNYCLECHTAVPTRSLDALRSVEWARDIPCDTLRKAYEGIWQTDTLIAAFQNSANDVRSVGIDTSAQTKRINTQRVIAERFTGDEVVSLAVISNQYQTVRFQMNKSYVAMNDARAARDRTFILIAVLLATAFVVIGIFLGWRNTMKGKGKAVHSRAAWVLVAVGMIVVFILFANPLFASAPPLPTPTKEETERQTAVDQATRVSDAIARFSVQSWVIGHIGAQWNATDKTQANAAYADALQAARDKDANIAAYWGQLQTVRESAVAWNAATQDLAVFRADKIETTALQSWQYRAIANEWLTVDKVKATEVLQLALDSISKSQIPNPNLQRDLELRAIAVAWAKLDAAKGSELIAQVQDPFLRAWGWREMGQYDKAIQIARQVQAPYDRAWALREIARASGNVVPLSDALDAANKIENAETRAYALADVAIVWAAKDDAKAREIIEKIPAAYSEARVMAWRGLGNAITNEARAKDAFGFAFDEAKRVGDRYKSGKLTAALLVDYARYAPDVIPDSVYELSDSFLRDQVYVALAPRVQTVNSTDRITSPAMRVVALTEIGKAALQAGDKSKAGAMFTDAFALADKVEDVSVLRDLAIAWAVLDPQTALAAVDKLEEPADKVAALQAIALELAKTDKKQSAEVFDRAVNIAKSVRLRGESFASARTLASLASSYAAIDATRANQAFAAAIESAKRVNVKY